MFSISTGIARSLLGAFAAILLLPGLAGCTGPIRTTSPVQTLPPPWWASYLTVDDDLKAAGLTDLRLTRSRTDSGFLRLVGEYFNESDSKLTVIFRFTWIDASGQPVDSILSGWQAVPALPRTRTTFSGIAPRGDIEEFRVELISADRLKGKPAEAASGTEPGQ